jgi:hypothetical protein
MVVPPIEIAPPAPVTDVVDRIAMPLASKQTGGVPIAVLLDPVQDAPYPTAIDDSVSDVK